MLRLGKQKRVPPLFWDGDGVHYFIRGVWQNERDQAGDYCFINYCVRNIGGTIEEQIDGAFDEMEERLALVGLTLEHVVQMNCLFKKRY